MIMRLVLSLLTVSLKSFEQANPSRNEVRVRTTLDGNLAMVEISQNGRALPPEVVQNLGDFTRLASIGGELALNMGVADQLATSLGGTLAILNAPDGSTVFRLSLPTADGDLSLLQREPDRGEPSGNVFFIDDDKNQLRSYRRYFEKSFHIFQAEDVEAAQNALSIRQDFNAIVMDLLLPESNGLALLRHIGERYQRLMDKTVVLVPPGLSRETIKAIKASNAMMLYKPVELDSLGSVLSHVVRRSSSKKS
jgi:ActR/RegA family two-component response regulator